MSRIAIASVVAGSLIALAGAARADAVMDWNNLAAVISETDGTAHPEPATKWSPKEDAEEIVAVAIFQAVNTIHPLYTPAREALAPPVGGASVVAAVAAAAHSALLSMFPERKAILDDDFAVMLADVPKGPARAAGIEVGERAAAQVIGWRTADHAPSAPPIRIAAPPGHWVPTTPNKIPAYYATAKPWLLSSPSQFRPKPPVNLVSEEWARDYNETRSLGGRDSATRTAEWTRLATFYSQWQQWPLVRQVAATPGRTLEQNARLYAMAAMATEDADIAMVDGKLTYSFWRPITAIRNGDQDGNTATERDADWEPLLKTPMHPEYPCGHCVVISALATVLATEGPPPPGGIAVMSDAMPGVVRYVESWPKLAEEVSLSRIYAGAHFRHSMEVGADLGKRVAEYELQGFLKTLH
jgi:PAP2 superfamily protein